jgi:hypothetical protein
MQKNKSIFSVLAGRGIPLPAGLNGYLTNSSGNTFLAIPDTFPSLSIGDVIELSTGTYSGRLLQIIQDNGTGAGYHSYRVFSLPSEFSPALPLYPITVPVIPAPGFSLTAQTAQPKPSQAWQLEDALIDTIDLGGGYNGVAHEALSYAAGKVGQALSLTGARNNGFKVTSAVDIANDAFSISAWIKPNNDYAANAGYIFGKSNAGVGTGWDFRWSNNIFYVVGLTGWATSITTASYPKDAWYHIVIASPVSGGGDAILYINNAIAGTCVRAYVAPSDQPFCVGGIEGGAGVFGGSGFPGLMDQVRYYYQATLDAGQVSYLYNGGNGR